MKTVKSARALALTLAAGLAQTVQAHFLVMHTPEMLLSRSADIDMAIVFTHAFDGGPTMELSGLENFYAMQLKAGDEEMTRIDLMEYLTPIDWADGDHTVQAYKANIPRITMRSLGDYQVVAQPEPYYEAEEDIYIQQITKVIMNVGGAPTNWDQTLGLPAEIQALGKPYINWEGGVFTGRVLSHDEPVAGAEIEIEYLNQHPNLEAAAFTDGPFIEAAGPGYEYVSVRSDENGYFTMGLPKAGWWGIAALGVGSDTEHNGKEMSQDAVLWLEVRPID